MRSVIFLDHLDAGAAVFGDLVDVGPFHQAQTDVGMTQAVGRTRPAFAVEPEIFFVKNGLEKLALPFRKNEVDRLREGSFFITVFNSCSLLLPPALFVMAVRESFRAPALQKPHC